jgi:hypothetical protein
MDVRRPGTLVVVPNGGTDYIYAPEPDPEARKKTVTDAVRFLQSRGEVGALFVKGEYGDVPGTLPHEAAGLEASRAPDVIVAYSHDETTVVQGIRGITFSGSPRLRGNHGSFGPTDVHNTLVAAGPDFRVGMRDQLPSANVDVAPTIAKLLGLELRDATGRPLLEALQIGGEPLSRYSRTIDPPTTPKSDATGLDMMLPNNMPDPGKSRYTIELRTQTVRAGDRSYRYIDTARAIRK